MSPTELINKFNLKCTFLQAYGIICAIPSSWKSKIMYTLIYTYNLYSNILNSALKSNKRFRSSYVIRQHIPYLGSSISERM